MTTGFKKTIRFLHLWLGLLSGLVIFVICTTAAIWSFSPEIEDLTQSYRRVLPREKPFLPVSELRAIADRQLSGKKVQRLSFQGKDKSVIADFYGDGYYYIAYIDPYDGKVVKLKNEDRSFFRIMILGHYSLWLGKTGQQIVRWATVIFLTMLVSGIVLWWPRNRAARRQRFSIKLGASPKRLTYDLHNVLGFYASWVLFFAVLSGIVWTFDWASDAEYWLASGGKKAAPFREPLSALRIKGVQVPAAGAGHGIDSLYTTWRRQYGNRTQVTTIQFPGSDSAAIGLSFYPQEGRFSDADNRYFDQVTFREIPVAAWGNYADANGGEKMSRLNYDIHIGSIAGLPGRIAMFLAALIGASLPVTGVFIWLGRKKRR